MRIPIYTLELDEDKKPLLIKECSKNYPDIKNLCNPDEIVNMLNCVYHASRKAEEYAWLIAMNVKCKPLGIFELNHGSISSSIISIREMFVRLCLCDTEYFVLSHNHPSGDINPSNQDIEATDKICECAKLMGIKFLDHIIIGEDKYYSFKQDYYKQKKTRIGRGDDL